MGDDDARARGSAARDGDASSAETRPAIPRPRRRSVRPGRAAPPSQDVADAPSRGTGGSEGAPAARPFGASELHGTAVRPGGVPSGLRRDVPLAPLTSLELGGPARGFLAVHGVEALREAIAWARDRDMPWVVLGGGSNLVVADAGYPGLAIHMGLRGIATREDGDQVLVTAAAGEPWDALVAHVVARGWAGIECLSGIPGLVGATPIQNVGAYGQEVSDVLEAVQVLDTDSLRSEWLEPARCGFGYRDSAFKRDPGRRVVLAVRMRLRKGLPAAPRYAELERALRHVAQPSVDQLRNTVLDLRRAKSMVLDTGDENRRSVGSFFTNPVVGEANAARVAARAMRDGLISDTSQMPRFDMGDGRVKLAAGWLIERAGIARGLRRGPVGVSNRHALALVHHGGGTTRDLIALAREVRARVEDRFGVRLVPEPVMLGFAGDPLA